MLWELACWLDMFVCVMFFGRSEPTCGWMVRGIVVSPAHQGSSPSARIYFRIYVRISGDAHSVGGDVPVDEEAPTVTL